MHADAHRHAAARAAPQFLVQDHVIPVVEPGAAVFLGIRKAQQAEFAASMQERLRVTLDDLEALQRNQMEQLELSLTRLLDSVREARSTKRSREIRRVFDDYRQWVEDTLTTEPQPHVRVLAAFTR